MSRNTKKTVKIAKANKRLQTVVASVVVLAIVAVGVYLVSTGHAATEYASGYAANGTTGGTTSSVTGGSGPTGKAVQFGTVASTGGGGGGGNGNGCTSGSVVAPCIGSATTGASGWGTPTFDDEFSQDTSLNTQDWSSSYYNDGAVMNNVSTSANNLSFSGGALNMSLSSSSVGSLISTSPVAGASKGFQFTYGYVEAEVYFPGNGSAIDNWPAFWVTGESWPADGESDIAEGLGTLTSNYHSSAGSINSGQIAGTWSNAYHIYGIDRTPGKDYIYWDGKLVTSYASSDNGAQEFILFNVGYSSTWGAPLVTGTASQMKIKYVRVWPAAS